MRIRSRETWLRDRIPGRAGGGLIRALLILACSLMLFSGSALAAPVGRVGALSITPSRENIKVFWKKVEGADGYYAFIKDMSTGKARYVKLRNQTGVNFTGLTTSTRYKIWVRAYKGGSKGEASTVYTVRTKAPLKEKIVSKLSGIHTLYFEATLNETWQDVPQGTVVTVIKRSKTDEGLSSCKLPNGRLVEIVNSRLTYTKCLNVYGDYTTKVKERFVNQFDYFTSPGGYMVWVSTHFQRFYVFSGSVRHWKLERTCLCTTGGFETPTFAGTNYRIWYKKGDTPFDEYSYGKWGLFFGQFIHSWPYYNGQSVKTAGYATIGMYPCSHGCVRLKDEDAKWCYENLAEGTRVVIY